MDQNNPDQDVYLKLDPGGAASVEHKPNPTDDQSTVGYQVAQGAKFILEAIEATESPESIEEFLSTVPDKEAVLLQLKLMVQVTQQLSASITLWRIAELARGDK